MKKIIHPIAGGLAMAIIATFWLSSVSVELFGAPSDIVLVKSGVAWGILLLIPTMAMTVGSGWALAGKRQGGLIDVKRKRMALIAAIGLLIMIPAALFLAFRARAGVFDGGFYAVQAAELIAGPINLFLLGLNMRDGLRMSGRLKRVSR